MKPMMQSRYITWMAIRPLTFGDDHYEPGDKVPQKHLEPMRDPEVLVRTNRLAAVAKDMNKVPRYLRKDVTDEKEMRAKILAPRIASQIGDIYPDHLLPRDEVVEDVGETEGEAGAPADAGTPEEVSSDEVPAPDPGTEPADDGEGDPGAVEADPVVTIEDNTDA